MELLKRGWPAGDEPRYDPDHALMLCRMMAFRPGLCFLYENLRLFREVLQVRRTSTFDHVWPPNLQVRKTLSDMLEHGPSRLSTIDLCSSQMNTRFASNM